MHVYSIHNLDEKLDWYVYSTLDVKLDWYVYSTLDVKLDWYVSKNFVVLYSTLHAYVCEIHGDIDWN